ncbi:DUF7511 domain-containing protein [Natronorubrum texcoconense]|uniref:DUF7511 domain-containing protein n=1 Tax=Natronorubrum texcoconense TaxID=1095776 RepID=A0A1G9HAQ3_9EURY|nr:hypothetical protein [Natronorubrum texcoconense]SDL09955.1 hypothetical protein SAMN04515672_0174 [Natronorubrum texcoconense]
MSTESDGFDFDQELVEPNPNQPTPECEHILVENDDAPDELVIVPLTARGLHSEWITAHEGSFADLQEVR